MKHLAKKLFSLIMGLLVVFQISGSFVRVHADEKPTGNYNPSITYKQPEICGDDFNVESDWQNEKFKEDQYYISSEDTVHYNDPTYYVLNPDPSNPAKARRWKFVAEIREEENVPDETPVLDKVVILELNVYTLDEAREGSGLEAVKTRLETAYNAVQQPDEGYINAQKEAVRISTDKNLTSKDQLRAAYMFDASLTEGATQRREELGAEGNFIRMTLGLQTTTEIVAVLHYDAVEGWCAGRVHKNIYDQDNQMMYVTCDFESLCPIVLFTKVDLEKTACCDDCDENCLYCSLFCDGDHCRCKAAGVLTITLILEIILIAVLIVLHKTGKLEKLKNALKKAMKMNSIIPLPLLLFSTAGTFMGILIALNVLGVIAIVALLVFYLVVPKKKANDNSEETKDENASKVG